MKMLKEFRDFAVKGNVVDLAVGVIVGGAFGKIVSSLVGDMIMPLVGLLLGGVNFSGLSLTIGDTVVRYGMFFQTVVDFIIIAAALFVAVRAINKFKSEAPAAPAAPPAQEVLLTEIRDILRSK